MDLRADARASQATPPPRARTLRRPAEDGGTRACPDGGAPYPAARRAVRGPRPGARRPSRRGARRSQIRRPLNLDCGIKSDPCRRAAVPGLPHRAGPSGAGLTRARPCEELACLDVGAANSIEILPLDANELNRRFALWGMNRADVVKLRVAGMHQIGSD